VLNGIVRAAGAMYQVFVLNIISFWGLRFPNSEFFICMSLETVFKKVEPCAHY